MIRMVIDTGDGLLRVVCACGHEFFIWRGETIRCRCGAALT